MSKLTKQIIGGLLFMAFVGMLVDARRERAEELAKEKTENIVKAEECQIERNRSEQASIAHCENAAALFGQDISTDPTKLSYCLESRNEKLKKCEENGL